MGRERLAESLVVSYLPEPESHPLWNGIKELLRPANGEIPGEDELVWIAFDGPTLFGAGTTVLYDSGEASILACGGFQHRKWVAQAERLVSAWARDCGATKLTMRGRRGWARYFRALGWDASKIGDEWIYEKELARG